MISTLPVFAKRSKPVMQGKGKNRAAGVDPTRHDSIAPRTGAAGRDAQQARPVAVHDVERGGGGSVWIGYPNHPAGGPFIGEEGIDGVRQIPLRDLGSENRRELRLAFDLRRYIEGAAFGN